ncbi:MAG: imidazoleglycerol-phosphate dehydratase HisB [Lachnospiraceae bacterium]|nr:imidazoleglycerol-phosphate dehydratase HisB [Lachnospiraceae bacterium]
MSEARTASVSRKTAETDITVTINLDGCGKADVSTGIGFFDHMLCSLTKHGLFDLTVKACGDLNVDTHHTAEDTGIVLGQAIKEALGDKAGIKRSGYFIMPMDDALALAAVDLSGRPFLVMDADFSVEKIGDLETEVIREFFYAVAVNAEMNIHLWRMAGENNHHIAEALFKAFGKALDMAVQNDPRISGVLSTKGSL